MAKRSAPLRSGSMFFGDLAAVNLKVDHFSFVTSFQHSHTDKRGSNTFNSLIKKLLAVQSQILSCLRSTEGKSQFSDANVLS